MGVYGLLTYLKYHCPKARYLVDLPVLIAQEKERSQTGRPPVIVVDAPSCYSLWCEGIDWTIGLEVQEISASLRSFVQQFNEMGADLVFFIGGLTPLKKRKTWLRRRIEGIQNMMDVYDILYANKTYEDIPKDKNSVPPNIGNFMAYVLKHVLGCKVFQTIRECDDELINYVLENDCFAIFANDTDFIVSQVGCKVLGADTYDRVKKTTFMYDRVELCKNLNIGIDQLPLLAILAGNDVVSRESVKPFQHRLCGKLENEHIPYKELMERIALYINTLPRRLTSKVFRKICVDVFEDVGKVRLMMRGFYAYTPHGTVDYYSGDDAWSRTMKVAKILFQEHVTLPPSAWGVMNKQIYESSVCFEDFRKINNFNEDVKLWPSATVTRELRRRFYGVLLFEKRNPKITVREWCAENVDSYVKTVRVKPEYPLVHPGLRTLWEAKPKDLNKWKLFLWAVSPTISTSTIAEWMALPGDLVVSTATCYYLHREKYFLTIKETKAVLMTLAMVSDNNNANLEPIRRMKKVIRSFRATQISVTFSRAYSLVFSLMASVGYPVKLSKRTAHIKFEPLLFHLLYKKVTELSANLDEICETNLNVLKNLQKMEEIVLNGAVIM